MMTQIILSKYSSLNIGGSCDVTDVSSLDEVRDVAVEALRNEKSIHFLGAGTNTYFGKNVTDFSFISFISDTVKYREINEKEVEVTVGASVAFDALVKETVERGFCGLENLSYIPGTVGASPVQNIGAYGVELADVFVSCEVFDCEDMKQKTFSKEECRFGYRDSIFKQEKNRYCIMSVTLLLNREKKFTLTYNPLNRLVEQEGLTVSQVREEVIKIRKEKLPDWKEHPNCGSFFKNPIIDEETSKKLLANYETAPLIRTDGGLKVSSAWLIDHVAHMKGVRRGSLYTWSKQPLVIVNDGNATADDVDAFAKEIAGSVFEKTGIVLEQEVNRVG